MQRNVLAGIRRDPPSGGVPVSRHELSFDTLSVALLSKAVVLKARIQS